MTPADERRGDRATKQSRAATLNTASRYRHDFAARNQRWIIFILKAGRGWKTTRIKLPSPSRVTESASDGNLRIARRIKILGFGAGRGAMVSRGVLGAPPAVEKGGLSRGFAPVAQDLCTAQMWQRCAQASLDRNNRARPSRRLHNDVARRSRFPFTKFRWRCILLGARPKFSARCSGRSVLC